MAASNAWKRMPGSYAPLLAMCLTTRTASSMAWSLSARAASAVFFRSSSASMACLAQITSSAVPGLGDRGQLAEQVSAAQSVPSP